MTRSSTPRASSNDGASRTTCGLSNRTPRGPAWREQDRRQQVARARHHVHNVLEPERNRKRLSDGWWLVAVEADHRLIEVGGIGGMLAQVLKEGHAVSLVKAGVARFERIQDFLPAVPERAAERDRTWREPTPAHRF